MNKLPFLGENYWGSDRAGTWGAGWGKEALSVLYTLGAKLGPNSSAHQVKVSRNAGEGREVTPRLTILCEVQGSCSGKKTLLPSIVALARPRPLLALLTSFFPGKVPRFLPLKAFPTPQVTPEEFLVPWPSPQDSCPCCIWPAIPSNSTPVWGGAAALPSAAQGWVGNPSSLESL